MKLMGSCGHEFNYPDGSVSPDSIKCAACGKTVAIYGIDLKPGEPCAECGEGFYRPQHARLVGQPRTSGHVYVAPASPVAPRAAPEPRTRKWRDLVAESMPKGEIVVVVHSRHHPTNHTEDKQMAKGEWNEVSPAERARTYTYAGGEVLRYENVNRVKVSESGTHYLETASGGKTIVAPGWRSVELDMDAWTF